MSPRRRLRAAPPATGTGRAGARTDRRGTAPPAAVSRADLAPLATLALACLAVPALACLGLAPEPTVNLRWNVAAEGEEEAREARAIGGRATITVSGRIRASLPCDPLDGELLGSGDRLRLVVTVLGGVNSCPGGVVTYAYVASIVNVDAGTRDLVVEHRFEGPARPAEVVFEGTVDVR